MGTLNGFRKIFLMVIFASIAVAIAKAQDATGARAARHYWRVGTEVSYPEGVYMSNGSEGYAVEFTAGTPASKIRITFLERPEYGGDFTIIQGSVPAAGEVSISVSGPRYDGYCTHGQTGRMHLTIKDKQHFYFDASNLELEFRKSSKKERLSFSLKLPSAIPPSDD